MRQRPVCPGFTLIEVLVAVTLIGIVVSIVYGSLAATARSAQAYMGRLSASTRGRLDLGQVEASLRCCSRELSAHASELRMVTTKPMVNDAKGQEGLFDAALRWDRDAGTIFVAQRRHVPRLSTGEDLQASQPLLDRVVDVKWSFWNGTTWRQDWDTKKDRVLPLLIRLDLTVQDARHRLYELQSTVAPWCVTKAETTVIDANGPSGP